MVKIRLHGTAEEISQAISVIKENFNILNKSDAYADRGESRYSRVYIDAEVKDESSKTIEEFKKLLERQKDLIVSKNIDRTYGCAFMLATGFFGETPINLAQVENIICDFAVRNTAAKLDDYINAIFTSRENQK